MSEAFSNADEDMVWLKRVAGPVDVGMDAKITLDNAIVATEQANENIRIEV